MNYSSTNTIVCFSHLRWNFVYRRPQHLLSRFAKCFRIFFIEEPIIYEGMDRVELKSPHENVQVVIPYLQSSLSEDMEERQKKLLSMLFRQQSIENYIFWYYTPQALSISDGFSPKLTVYDCMDELSAFKLAPGELKQPEKKLISKADVVFTSGTGLYEAKKNLHEEVYCFPSSIDKSHFSKARSYQQEPEDQASIPYPRIGFYGVVDERFDGELLREVAEYRPDWHFVIIGPVVKINSSSLPQASNIHYLGNKTYRELPQYLSGWDMATCLFARNESTKYISPTKTPEYLAGGKPVISTNIKDVAETYGKNELVYIVDTAQEFIECVEKELAIKDKTNWLEKVDAFLRDHSWDRTWAGMMVLISHKLKAKEAVLSHKNSALSQLLFDKSELTAAVM